MSSQFLTGEQDDLAIVARAGPERFTVNQPRHGNYEQSLDAGRMHACLTDKPAVNLTSDNEFVVEPNSSGNNAYAIQKALDACAALGGGRVVLRPGVHYSGTIHLRSHVTLHLENEAILLGSTDIDDYGRKSGTPGARIVNGIATALVFAEKAEDIAITGEGTIDGNGRAFWEKKEDVPEWVHEKEKMGTWIPGFTCGARERPRALIMLIECQNVRIESIRIENSPSWAVHPLACTDLVLRGITLRGAVDGSNTDGIDLDSCSDVLVEDCDIVTGDDAIALKNTNAWGLKRPSRNIIVRKCRLCSTTHGFTIGTETEEDFEDITFSDSQVEMADGHRTLTGIGLSILDGMAIRRMQISNITISDAVAPIQIRLGNAGRGQDIPKPGILEDITLENISIVRAYGNNMIVGLPHHPLRRVVLRNVEIDFTGLVDSTRVMSGVPELDKEFPDAHVWRFLPAYGLFCRHIDGLELSNVTFTAPIEEKRPDMLFKNVSGLSIRDADGVTSRSQV
jgi:polygalacturonase